MSDLKIWRDALFQAEQAGPCNMVNQHFMEILFEAVLNSSKMGSKIKIEFVDSHKDQSPCWESFLEAYYEIVPTDKQ